MSSGYVLALDVGNRRIGVALASVIARLPAPLTVIDRNKTADVVAEIVDLVKKNEVKTVVVGLPRDMTGNETDQTIAVREFAAQISKELNIPVIMQDEAVTSVLAEERLKNRGKPYDKGDIDAEAAVMILDDYLKTTERRTA